MVLNFLTTHDVMDNMAASLTAGVENHHSFGSGGVSSHSNLTVIPMTSDYKDIVIKGSAGKALNSLDLSRVSVLCSIYIFTALHNCSSSGSLVFPIDYLYSFGDKM